MNRVLFDFFFTQQNKNNFFEENFPGQEKADTTSKLTKILLDVDH